MIDPGQKDVYRGYATRRETWRIAGRSFDLTWPVDIDGLLDSPATQRRFEKDEYMPYWAQPWPASVLLAESVLSGPQGGGRPAVEIGCGIGVAGLAAAMMDWSVTVGDYDEDAVQFARLNASRNGLALAGGEQIDYRIPLDCPCYDLVLGSDLVYERRNSEPVARWIASALRSGGMAMLSDPNRSAGDAFPRCAEQAGLIVHEERVESLAPAGLSNRGRIWRLSRAR